MCAERLRMCKKGGICSLIASVDNEIIGQPSTPLSLVDHSRSHPLASATRANN